MGQVPQYLIIGRGRVARHFLHYLSLLKIPCAQWDRTKKDSRLLELAAGATHALLLVSDGAIEAVARRTPAKMRVHFSGSLTTPLAQGAHPLMTFGETLYTLEEYKKIPFVVDKDAPDFAKLLPGLPNPHVRLSPELKAKYHALCVLAGNAGCMLWQKLFSSLEKEFGIPASTAHPYLQKQTENLIADYKTALTGPFARGDQETIARNLKALEGDPFHAVYKSIAEVT